MSAQIIDGKGIAKELRAELRQDVDASVDKGNRQPGLAVVLVGSDPASQVYVRNKKKACEYIGFCSVSYELSQKTSQAKLLELIEELNEREDIDGILVQMPLPEQIDEKVIIRAIRPSKDVDGFHPQNVGALCIGEPGFVSCTPAGIIQLLRRSGIEMSGRECVIVGRSNIVGKPMAMLMLRENATVTVAHSKTSDLKQVCKRADILIAAIGKAKMITADYIKEGATVIDVGINRDPETGKLQGDVDYENVREHAGAITPVPGGVGPMTIAMLMNNCYEAAAMNGKI